MDGRIGRVGRVSAVRFCVHGGSPFLVALVRVLVIVIELDFLEPDYKLPKAYTQAQNAIARLRTFSFYFFAQRVASV